MKKFRINKEIFIRLFVLIFVSTTGLITAQHRGDNLSFQGLLNTKDFSAKSLAMGNAVTALTGDLSAVFYNPAGLARINKIQVTVNANQYSQEWRESQNYRPDRYFVTLPFYLEGLYIPDPANNGKWDYQIVQDSSRYYPVSEPKLGVDNYSEEAADWKKNRNELGFTNLAAAIPFTIADKKLVAAISYNVNNNVYDFDRNDTYLDPHVGYFDYGGDISRVDGKKTLDMRWSRFTRERFGSIKNMTGAVSFEIFNNFFVGAGANVMWGETEDYQSLVRVGDFLLSNQQRFKFSYIDASEVTMGTSKYSSTSFNVGAIFELNRVCLGLNLELPYTLNREYNYNKIKSDSLIVTNEFSGKDEFEFPAIYTIGVSFNPVDDFKIAFDYRHAPYASAKYSIGSNDSTFRKWANQTTLSFGLEFRASKLISLSAGMSTIPQTFIPDGAAIKDKGPAATSYNAGLSLSFFFGRIDFAYQLRILKYYDQYFSNTNYAFNKSENLLIGYTYFIN